MAKEAVPAAPAQGEKEKGMVFTWPNLVRIEMIVMMIYLVLFTVMSIYINAPLRNLANPEVTPNPAKAPWYFLGLQELLLHMHPALAGVIVPTAVLVGLAVIPYLDTRRAGIGIWFSTRKGVPIAIFSFIYTFVWEVGLVLIDEFLVIKDMPESAHGIGPAMKTIMFKIFYGMPDPAKAGIEPTQLIPIITDWVMPAFFMLLIPALLVVLVKKIWKADTREVMIALFTFFVASYWILTIISTAFRGHSMKLMVPWEVGHPEESLQ